MSLKTEAATDVRDILTDSGACGAAWPVVLISPDGTEYNIECYSNDISHVVSHQTLEITAGRQASLAISTLDLIEQSIPSSIFGEHRSNRNPWRVRVDTVEGETYAFKISETYPDHSVGMILCYLELMQQ